MSHMTSTTARVEITTITGGDAAPLFHGGVRIGHYTITRS